MSKIFKDTHVYIPCPACGKIERVKLKWAQNHGSLKCEGCKGKVDLGANPARDLIARTGAALADYESTLDDLHAEAEDAATATPPRQAKGRTRKPAPRKNTAKKRAAARTTASLSPLPAERRSSDPV